MSNQDNKNLANPSTSSNGNNTRNGSRPVSFYDNFNENVSLNRTKLIDRTNKLNEISTSEVDSPTQAHCLMTTVPQNITAQNIADKHTPTRNSLRHSRMIALNKNGRVPRKYLPAIIRYHKLAKALLGFITLFGFALCFLALWLLLFTPNIRQRDNPHWSGIPVLLSGIIGLMLLCCCRKEYPGMKRNYLVYSVKVLSIFLSAFAAAAALIACTFATIHLISLYTLTCSPPDYLNTTCICRLESESNETTSNFPIKNYHYVDLTCPQVENILSILIIFSVVTNLLAGILEIWYIYLHWASRYIYIYSKVKTNENKPTVLTNTVRL